jgi:hypothetical protein
METGINHISEELVNEYLDQVLSPEVQVEVEAHLASCPACQVQLEDLGTLFAALEKLPDLALGHDLSPMVLRSIRPRGLPWRTGRWVFGLQMVLAVFLLVFSVPILASQFPEVRLDQISIEAASIFNQSIDNLMMTWSDWLVSANVFFSEWIEFTRPSAYFSGSPINLWLWVGLLGLVWLFGNGLLLGPFRKSARNGHHDK